MDKEQTRPVFLERRSYRQRRMMDAIRLLPLVGLLLWMVPLLWPVAQTPPDAGSVAPVKMSQAVIYVFCVWVGLILCAAGLWRRLSGTYVRADDNDAAQKAAD